MTASSAAAPVRRHRFRNWFLIIMAAVFLVAVVEAAGVFFLSKGARQLQQAVNSGLASSAQTKIQFSVGPALLGMGHLASIWIDDIPDEAREALGALRGASVGIYELDVSPSREQRFAMMRKTDERVSAQGWTRIVGVCEGNETVMIYVPTETSLEHELNFCVAVCEGKNLVVVSAQASTAAVMRLARAHSGELRELLKTPERDHA